MTGRRPWREKFADAIRGVALGLRGEPNFRVHVPAALLAAGAAAWLGCDRLEWALIAGSVGLVFTAELLNTALERLFHGLDDAAKGRISGCLDVAAGAVLAASLTAVAVGGMVLIPKLITACGPAH